MNATSDLLALCDAVVAMVNGGVDHDGDSFVLPVTAARAFVDRDPLDKITTDVVVDFLPGGDDEERLGGSPAISPSFEGRYDVDMIMYARVGAPLDPQFTGRCENLMVLRQQIRSYIKRAGAFAVVGAATFRAILIGVGLPAGVDAPYSQRNMSEKHVMTLFQRFTFRVTV